MQNTILNRPVYDRMLQITTLFHASLVDRPLYVFSYLLYCFSLSWYKSKADRIRSDIQQKLHLFHWGLKLHHSSISLGE